MRRSEAPETSQGQPGLIQAALFGLCPHCGAPTLFEAPAQIADRCRACGEDLAKLERGGRLAGILTLLIAGLLIGAAIALDIYVRPPIWVHVVLWVPLTIGSVLGALRLFKAASVYRTYLLASEPDP